MSLGNTQPYGGGQPLTTQNINQSIAQYLASNNIQPTSNSQAPFAQQSGPYNGYSVGQAQGVNPNIFQGYGQLGYSQVQGTNQLQNATNVVNVLPQLQSYLGGLQGQTSNYYNTLTGAGNNLTGGNYNVNLGTNFAGPQQLQNSLSGGLDYFGQSGLSQGLNNINLQRNQQNQQLSSQLGQQPGNNSLLGVLQGQNNFNSQLAGIPLMGQAQTQSYSDAMNNVNLQNQVQNSLNSTQLNQGGFNLNNYLSGLGAYGNAFTQSNNLGGLLSNLAGMQRGTATSQTQAGKQNFS